MMKIDLAQMIHDNMELRECFQKAKEKTMKENPKLRQKLSVVTLWDWERFCNETADSVPDEE